MYQVDVSGKVNTPAVSTKLPFAAVTFFNASASKDISQVQNFAGLKTAIDPLIVKKDHFYAIRINGTFSTIQVRSESKQEKPYPTLTDALKKQAVFNYQNVKGTLVGFWTPDDSGTLNAVGYHLHFISDDHTQGGHVLDVSVNTATVKVDETRYLTVDFSDSAQ
jgi:acetolactate decarboxylase